MRDQKHTLIIVKRLKLQLSVNIKQFLNILMLSIYMQGIKIGFRLASIK